MFDFDAGKLLVIGVVALIVIGPKDLPRVLRQLGQTVAQLRRLATEFQSQFMEAIRESELEDIRKDMAQLTEESRIKSTFNPLETVRRELTQALGDHPPEPPPPSNLTLEGLDVIEEHAGSDLDAMETPASESADAALKSEPASVREVAGPPDMNPDASIEAEPLRPADPLPAPQKVSGI